ncbi:TPA: hypothetical protein QCH65_004371 [Enterobacter roggenkampii]|nr:hypothetical protein [Enterobacter roggenkampii]
MTSSDKLILYRMMKADANNRPVLPTSSTSRDCLGVRYKSVDKKDESTPKVDVYIDDDGMVIVQNQGMSMTIPPKTNIPSFMLAPVRKLVRFAISRTHFEQHDHLMCIDNGKDHAMLIPRHEMHIEEYNQYLADTAPLWEVDDDDEEKS